MSSILNGSTQFWRDTITNLNPCECNRPETFIERELNESNKDTIQTKYKGTVVI